MHFEYKIMCVFSDEIQDQAPPFSIYQNILLRVTKSRRLDSAGAEAQTCPSLRAARV